MFSHLSKPPGGFSAWVIPPWAQIHGSENEIDCDMSFSPENSLRKISVFKISVSFQFSHWKRLWKIYPLSQ